MTNPAHPAPAVPAPPPGWRIERVDDRHIRVCDPCAAYNVILDLSDHALEMRVFWRLAVDLMEAAAQPGTEGDDEHREPAPPHSLPTWSECNRIIENDTFRQRAAAGLEGAVLDLPEVTPAPTALHRFIHEYDDSDPYRSDWFMHRLEQVVKEAAQPQEWDAPAEPHDSRGPTTLEGWRSAALAGEKERDWLRERLKTVDQHQGKDCWYWQNDGEDHLESMVHSLPVVIRADHLRALLGKGTPPKVADLLRECELFLRVLGLDSEPAAKLAADCRAALAVQAPQPAPAQTIKLGSYGQAFDLPGDRRAYTYKHQPGNQAAWRIGDAASRVEAGGDLIDRGLSLLKVLEAGGFGVFELDETAAIQAPEGEPKWKAGNEFLPYHPQASHVSPDYRDGWNACYRAALAAQPQAALKYQQANPLGGPAKVFRAMADAIEAGDGYDDTLRRYGYAEVKSSPAEAHGLTRDDLDLCRQWFNSVQDTNGGYLDRADYVLAERIYRALGLRVPSSITDPLGLPACDVQPNSTWVAPHPGSPEASAMIDSELAAHNWPTNTKNAARAGYVACMKLIASKVQPKGTEVVTAEMIEAAEGVEDLYKRGTPQTWAKVYRAMRAVAPGQAPAPAPDDFAKLREALAAHEAAQRIAVGNMEPRQAHTDAFAKRSTAALMVMQEAQPYVLKKLLAAYDAARATRSPVPAPIDMVLHCPSCGLQHIDASEEKTPENEATRWNNPPHRSHLCHGCGHVWRPADVPTNGVKVVQTKGKADSPIRAPAVHAGKPVAWCELTAGGQIAYFDGKPMVMPGPVGNDCHPHPLYLGTAQAQQGDAP